MNAKTLKTAIGKLLKGYKFAPSITGTPFWITDMATSQEVELKVYLTAKDSNIYFKLNGKTAGEQQYVTLGTFHNEIQDISSLEAGTILTGTVAIRKPNSAITPEELTSCIDKYGESSVVNYNKAIEEGYVSLVLLDYEE